MWESKNLRKPNLVKEEVMHTDRLHILTLKVKKEEQTSCPNNERLYSLGGI